LEDRPLLLAYGFEP